MIRIDYIFSYWIFTWFLLFLIFPTKVPSPLLAFIIAFIINVGEVLYLVTLNVPKLRILIYLLQIVIAKMIPIGIIYYYFNKKNSLSNDVSIMFGLFIIYNIYLYINKTNFLKINRDIVESIEKGNNNTPFFYLISKYMPSF
jgi:hypothetical protein